MSSLLIISKNYWSANMSESTALKLENVFFNIVGIKDIDKIIGNSVNIESVKNKLYNWVGQIVKNENEKNIYLYIYINGHGNQTIDNNNEEEDGMDELFQLPDGNLLDDEITDIINRAIKENYKGSIKPIIILISDHCSSGSMLDKRSDLSYNWVTIGSSLDYQDSLMTGDGNVMTIILLNVIEKCFKEKSNIKIKDFFDLLKNEMKNSFVGELQIPTLHTSDLEMLEYKFFNNLN